VLTQINNNSNVNYVCGSAPADKAQSGNKKAKEKHYHVSVHFHHNREKKEKTGVVVVVVGKDCVLRWKQRGVYSRRN